MAVKSPFNLAVPRFQGLCAGEQTLLVSARPVLPGEPKSQGMDGIMPHQASRNGISRRG